MSPCLFLIKITLIISLSHNIFLELLIFLPINNNKKYPSVEKFFIFAQNTVHDVYFMKITRKTHVTMLNSE